MELLRRLVVLVVTFCMQYQPLFFPANLMPKSLGIPSQTTYSEQQRLARSVWDMEVYGNTLYIGSGDYSANTGPTPIYAYDIPQQTWTIATTVGDESVNRFCKTEDGLLVPGIDSTTTTWEFGNYHTLAAGQWTSFDKLPGAVHNFDIVQFEDSLFFGLGTADGKSAPVLRSPDGQTDFQPVAFYKDGASLLDGSFSFTRVYDFFVVGGSLYCLLYGFSNAGTQLRAFCRYEDGAFQYLCDAAMEFGSWKQIPLMGKAAAENVQYISTGRLYKTEDFQTLTPVEMPDGGTVTDLYAYDWENGRLIYALSNVKNEDGTYTATVYLLGDTVTAVISHTAQSPALSLARHGMYLYLGHGGSASFEDTGTVIRLSILSRLF